jgi:hypothetical protein
MPIIKSLKKFAKTNPLLKFNANIFVLKLYYNYLIQKYDTGCGKKENNGLIIYVPGYQNSNNYHHITIKENAKNYVSCIEECIQRNKKFVVSTIHLELYEYTKNGHSNMLMYRASNNTLEYFEPHGYKFQGENSENVNKGVENFLTRFVAEVNKQLRDKNLPEVTLVPTNEICPSKGFQHIEELYFDSTLGKNSKLKRSITEDGGNCVLWSFFYAEMCLRNPDFTGKEIVEKIMNELGKLESKKASEYMRRVIRGYRNYIYQKIYEQYKEKFGNKFTEENLLKTLDAFKKEADANIDPGKIEMSPEDTKSTNESLTSVSSDYKKKVEDFEEKQKAILEKYKNQILSEGEKYKTINKNKYEDYQTVANNLGKHKKTYNYIDNELKKLYQSVWLKYMNEMGKTKYGKK